MEKRYCLDHRKLSVIGIPITTKCNLNCRHCLRQVWHEYVNKDWYISVTQATEIAEKISGKTEYVNLSAGYGETLLHDEAVEITNIFRNNGIKTIIYSNGTNDIMDKLERLKTDIFVYSTDIYHHADINCFKNHVEYFINYANRVKYAFADKFIISCVIEPDLQSREVIEYLVNICKNDERIYLEFHWRMFYEEHLNCSDKNEMFIRWLADLPVNKTISIPALDRKVKNECNDIFDSLYFDYNGNVRKCCVFMESDAECNIYKMEIDEIIKSTLMNKWQMEWRDRGEFVFCRNCPIGHGFLG